MLSRAGKLLSAAVVAGCGALVTGPATAATSAPAPSSGRAILDVRLRHEAVDDDLFVRRASATTLRTRLGWQSATRRGWSAVAEIEDTRALADDRFNSSANGKTDYPTIADPDNTELNQLYVAYAGPSGRRLAVGRQRLNYDNQRFIGSVGWRQNEQTFDAVDWQHPMGRSWKLRYSYLDRVQRVFGADNPNPLLARFQLDAHLFSATRAVGSGQLTGYVHLMDNQSLPLTSHRNVGLRYTIKRERPAGFGWQASAEFASQDAYADGSNTIDADYRLLEGVLVWRANQFKLGVERLDGNGSYAFQTPFATLHAFNGWADRFLTTPVNGLQDRYVGWNRKRGEWNATVVWHGFDATRGSARLGSEWDASLSWAFAPKWNALLKHADFRKGEVGADVAKSWLSVEYAY